MTPEADEKIAFLQRFKADVVSHFNGAYDESTRVRINRGMRRAKKIITEAGAMKTVTLSPPPAVGGMIVRNADPFSFILQSYYGMSMAPTVADMIEEAIGFIESPEYERQRTEALSEKRRDIAKAAKGREPAELPEKVTLSWLVRHVPISFWLWFAGIVAAAVAAGVKVAPLLK